LARPDFRATAARRLSEDRDLSPAIVSLISSDNVGRSRGVRVIPVGRIESNPNQPRMVFDEEALHELAASIREHGVLQPILVRPLGENRYQLIAGERRWRAAREAGLETIAALVEDIDDDTALEISIIENLQREDLSPLEEAAMYDRMIHEHGYSIRKLAEKLGKDKGYLENRLRLANAPEEIRDLVSLRKDTLSHAYELLKVADPKKRRKLAAQVAAGELSLVKLRERIEGRRPRTPALLDDVSGPTADNAASIDRDAAEDNGWAERTTREEPLSDDSLVHARHQLNDAVEDLVSVLRSPDVVRSIPDVDRTNLAKYLTIAKLKLENAIAVVRAGSGE
jgi:ParB family chromosome partitioning protein